MNPLNWMLDVNAKLGQLPTLDRTLDSIFKRLEKLDPQLKKTIKGFAMVTGAAGVLGRGVAAMGSMWTRAMNGAADSVKTFGRDALAHFTALATFNGLVALGRSALNLGKRLIDVVAGAERADAVLTNLVGPEKARHIDVLANQISGATEFDEDDLKRFAGGLLRVGFAFDKLPNAWALGADIAALTDADPAQTLGEVGAALEKLQQRGGLDTRILMGMGIQKKDFFADLGKRLGVGAAAAEKLAGEGKNADAVFAQLVATVQKATGGATPGTLAEKMGEGLFATVARLKRVPDDLFKAVRGTQASDDLAHGFARLAEQLGPDGPVGSRIVGGLSAVMKLAGESLKNVDLGKVLDDLIAFGESAKQVWAVFATVFAGVAKVFDWVGTAIGYAAAELYLEVENIMSFGQRIGDFFGGLVVTIVDYASKFFEGAKFLGIRVWEGLKEGISSGIDSATGAVGKLVNAITGTTEEKLEIRSPSRVFERYGMLTGEGFAKGLRGVEPVVEDATAQVVRVPAPSQDVGLGLSGGSRGRREVSISAPITVHLHGGAAGQANPQAIAQAIADILPSQLQAAWERMAVEMGAG